MNFLSLYSQLRQYLNEEHAFWIAAIIFKMAEYPKKQVYK